VLRPTDTVPSEHDSPGGSVARSGKFVIKNGRGAKTHFVLMASNGRIVVTSETYESKESCLKGIAAVKRLPADATVVDDPIPATTGRRDRTSSTGTSATSR
jgi:uncharacterized protein YegP (UPF0339 family)